MTPGPYGARTTAAGVTDTLTDPVVGPADSADFGARGWTLELRAARAARAALRDLTRDAVDHPVAGIMRQSLYRVAEALRPGRAR